MLRQVLIVAFASSLLAAPAAAQTPANQPATLSDRLEQFRQELLGEPSKPPVKKRPASPNSQGSPTQQHAPAAQSQPANPNQPQPAGNGGTLRPIANDPNRAQLGPQPTLAREPTLAVETAGPMEPSVSSRRSSDTAGQSFRKSSLNSGLNSLPIDAAGSPVSAQQDKPSASRDADFSGVAERPIEDRPSSLRSAKLDRPMMSPVPLGPAGDGASTEAKRTLNDSVLMTGQSPVLMVETVGPRKVLIGKEAVFIVRVRNSGDAAATNVIVAVNVPSSSEVLSTQSSVGTLRSPEGAVRTEALAWHISRLEPRARETLTLRLVPRKSAPIDLAVQWTCSPESSQTVIEVQEPKLALAMSGPSEIPFGQSKVYKLTMSNPGTGDAENVIVSFLPTGRGSDAPTSHRVGTLKAGTSKSIEVELTARQAGTLAINAEALADGGLHAETSEQVTVRRAGLKVEVQAPRTKFAGTTATYRVQVVNTGNAAAEKVHLSAMLPPQAKYLSCTAGGHVEPGQEKISWMIGSLQAGAERTVEIQCTVQAPGDNRLQVACSAADDLASSAVGTTRVEAVADLKLEVRDPQGPVSTSDEAVYELVIRNRGTKSAERIDLVVFFSEGLEAVACHGHPHQIDRGQVMFRTIPVLAAGSEVVLRVHARADKAGNHVFRAEVASQSPRAKLSAEETTLFYGEDSTDKPATLPDRDAGDATLQPIEAR